DVENDGGGVGCGGVAVGLVAVVGWGVEESGSEDRIDPVTRSLFGLCRKMPAGKLFRRRRVVAGGGGARRRRC
ncbi:hypothetical protein Tco_1572957, partial [Tanacetum coccineum]